MTVTIEELADSLGHIARDPSLEIHNTMIDMGPRIARMMQRALAPHRYTGDLEKSITWQYDASKRELRVGSDLQRGGRYNAMALLSYGTGPISHLHFTPIAKWAAFKGLPAGPVWMSIKKKGTAPHPIMDKLEAQPEFSKVLNEGAKRLGTDLLLKGFGAKKSIKG